MARRCWPGCGACATASWDPSSRGVDTFPDETRLTGRAVFEGPDALRIDDHTRLRFKAAVLATGSSPSVPEPLKGLGDRVLTTDTVFEIEDLPASLAVLGAGPVGLELAQAMARLGVATSVFDPGDSLGGLRDPDLKRAAREIFSEAFDLHLGAKVESGEIAGEGARLGWDGAGGQGRQDVRSGARRGGPSAERFGNRPRAHRCDPQRQGRPGPRSPLAALRGRADPDRGRRQCRPPGAARGKPSGPHRRAQRRAARPRRGGRAAGALGRAHHGVQRSANRRDRRRLRPASGSPRRPRRFLRPGPGSGDGPGAGRHPPLCGGRRAPCRRRADRPGGGASRSSPGLCGAGRAGRAALARPAVLPSDSGRGPRHGALGSRRLPEVTIPRRGCHLAFVETRGRRFAAATSGYPLCRGGLYVIRQSSVFSGTWSDFRGDRNACRWQTRHCLTGAWQAYRLP
ncbi:protein of unknown function [Methylorubrum extorquens]|uniref:FAD/NAD(P)-binding domain-containing protein n=1 Tax=Methylorubrum extorquens TaxID=408 RepID=A0A2N9AL48_METEX|nr:protein of unknown function [Methylorubrum extorquens]